MPVKREHSSDLDELSQEDNLKPTIDTNPTKKSKSDSNPSTPTKKAQTSPKKPKSESPNKKMGSWNGEELKLLYSIMCPKRNGINWNEVSNQIEGRDAKSCNNKWTRMQAKIMQAIENLGE